MRISALWPQIGSLGPLPPGLAGRPDPHPVLVAEAEEPRERRGRAAPRDGGLQDRKARIGFHDPDQAQHGLRGHRAVRVEDQREVEARCSAFIEEVHQVAGLEAGVLRAAAVEHGSWRKAGRDALGSRLLPRRRLARGRVGQDGEGEAPALRPCAERLEQRGRRWQHLLHGFELRTQRARTVREVEGAVSRAAAATRSAGSTAAAGSGAPSRRARPTMAVAADRPSQGALATKQSPISASQIVQPPPASTCHARSRNPEASARTRAAKPARCHRSRSPRRMPSGAPRPP